MQAFDVATGKPLYQKGLIYSAYSYTPYDYDTIFTLPTTEVLDETKIIAHPSGTMFLTFSKQYVKVLDARSGELLQRLVSPPMDYARKKPRLSDKPLVYKADWSDDGKTLYIISADRRSVSLWKLL